MADNFPLTPGSGRNAATDEVTYSADVADVQLIRPVLVTGAEGSKTVVDLGGDAANGLDVDVTRLPALAAGTNNIGDVDVLTVPAPLSTTGGGTEATALRVTLASNSTGVLAVQGNVAHDAVDAGNPVKMGGRAIAHGTNPTEVAAGDRADLLVNRAGVPFFMGGHPHIQTIRLQFTAAQTNVAIITAAAAVKIVVTAIQVTLDNASTVFPSVRIGFGAATTPTASQVIAAHGGVPAGGGFSRGDGSGILGVGADDDDLRITTVGTATGGGMEVVVTYYTTA